MAAQQIVIRFDPERGLEIAGIDIAAEQAAALLSGHQDPFLDFARALEERLRQGGELASELRSLSTDHPAVLAIMASCPGQAVRHESLLHYTRVPRFVLQRFLLGEFASQALHNSQITAEELEIASRHRSEYVRQQVAEHPQLTPSLERKLAQDPDPTVREALAKHAKQAEVLRKLAQDRRHAVRAAARARQGVAGEDPIEQVMAETSSRVVFQAMDAARGGEPMLHRLAAHKLPPVRQRVAEMTQDPELLARLAQDPALRVRIAAAGNPKTPVEELERLEQFHSGLEAELKEREPLALALLANPGLPPSLAPGLCEGVGLDALNDAYRRFNYSTAKVPAAYLQAAYRRALAEQSRWAARDILDYCRYIAKRQRIDLEAELGL